MVKKKFFRFDKNFLIAEAGINHNGKLKTALKLVDVAKKSGAGTVRTFLQQLQHFALFLGNTCLNLNT